MLKCEQNLGNLGTQSVSTAIKLHYWYVLITDSTFRWKEISCAVPKDVRYLEFGKFDLLCVLCSEHRGTYICTLLAM